VQVKNPLEGVPRQITGAIGDIRRIADGMQALPELVRVLTRIEETTESLDAEVKRMRAPRSQNSKRTPPSFRPSSTRWPGPSTPLRRTLSRFGRGNGELDEDE
jgi:hypothetical protein